MPSKPGTAASMRKCWADPLWRANQIRLISKSIKPAIGRQKGQLIYITVGLEKDLSAALRAQVARSNTSMCEIVRTYIQWGLDAEAEGESENL